MSQDSESGSSFGEQAVFPILVECDRQGRVLWMSRRTRLVLHAPKEIIDIIAIKTLRHPLYGFEISNLRFWKVCDLQDSMLIGAIGTVQLPVSQDLSSLDGNLTRNLLRLLEVERRLSERAGRRRRDRGRNTIRQIELERQRLGRDLHTGVGQLLAAIRWQLEVIQVEMPAPPESVQLALERISTLTAQTLDQVRSLSVRLHPPDWQRLPLESAIRQLWEISAIPQRLQASLRIDPLPFEPDLEVKVLIYRTFQEAISNLARHSQATSIDVELRIRESMLVMSIKDNGVGFDMEKLLSPKAELAGGIGLRSIREMAEAVGGIFRVESSPSGTTLVVSVAFSQPHN